MAAGFDPVRFIQGFTSTPIKGVEDFKEIEGLALANIRSCFTAENAPKLRGSLTPEQLLEFKNRISLLATSTSLKSGDRFELQALAKRVDSITPKMAGGGVGKIGGLETIKSAPKLSERDKRALGELVKQVNLTLERHGSAARVTPEEVLLNMPYFDRTKSFINEHGYISARVPFIKQKNEKTGEDEILQLFIQVDASGKFTGDLDEIYLSASEREFYKPWAER